MWVMHHPGAYRRALCSDEFRSRTMWIRRRWRRLKKDKILQASCKTSDLESAPARRKFLCCAMVVHEAQKCIVRCTIRGKKRGKKALFGRMLRVKSGSVIYKPDNTGV